MSAAFLSCKNVSTPRYLRQAPAPSRQLCLTCTVHYHVSGSVSECAYLCTLASVCATSCEGLWVRMCPSVCMHTCCLCYTSVPLCLCVPVC